MSEQNSTPDQDGTTSPEQLNEDGIGGTTTPGAESTFEPEEPEHPADDK